MDSIHEVLWVGGYPSDFLEFGLKIFSAAFDHFWYYLLFVDLQLTKKKGHQNQENRRKMRPNDDFIIYFYWLRNVVARCGLSYFLMFISHNLVSFTLKFKQFLLKSIHMHSSKKKSMILIIVLMVIFGGMPIMVVSPVYLCVIHLFLFAICIIFFAFILILLLLWFMQIAEIRIK